MDYACICNSKSFPINNKKSIKITGNALNMFLAYINPQNLFVLLHGYYQC